MNTRALQAALDLTAAKLLRVNNLYGDAEDAIEGFTDTVRGVPRDKTSRSTGVSQGGDSEGLAKAIGGQFSAILGVVSAKFLAVLAPVALLAAAIGAESSGFQVFLTTMRLAATVLGTLFVPLFVVAGAAILALAGIISDALLPNLKEYYTFILTNAMAAVRAIESGFNQLASIAKVLYEAFQSIVNWVSDKLQNTETGQAIVKAAKDRDIIGAGVDYARTKTRESARGADLDNQLAELNRRRAERAAGGNQLPKLRLDPNGVPIVEPSNGQIAAPAADKRPPAGKLIAQDPTPKPAPTFADRFLSGIRDFNKELRFQNGSRASIGEVSGVARNAQLAAIQQSPIEQKQLEVMQKMLGSLDQAVAELGVIKQKPAGLQ